jgi:chromosome segregation protein
LRSTLYIEEGIEEVIVRADEGERRALELLREEEARIHEDREMAQLRDQEEKHRRNSLVERIDEEYGVDLAALIEREEDALALVKEPSGGDAGQPSGPSVSLELECLLPSPDWDRERAREEIRELQEKIRRLGGVNLEALDELKELEERSRFQLAQRNDLLESEKNLRAIIGEINSTSRQLFLKTFEEIQSHFSEIFRKCFGGGKAELVLEEGVDVLEAGIDIVAKPPGKKITRLSLMSGGEKTMTTIALLFAIFRTRPSPFCILDEVDAPLDETNVRRFVVLLKDFIQRTQFVVITHNKLTMAEAGTLYGVTMEERGVSKRVSVELSTYDPERLEAAAV